MTNILGVNISSVNKKQAVDLLQKFLKKEKNHIVITPNPEIVVKATKDQELLNIINQADLVVADGIGIVIASKVTDKPLEERVPGIELVLDFFDSVTQPISVYLFGAKPGVVELAKENIEKKYKCINIIGTSSGYFDKSEEISIVENIRSLKPDVLLVGLGAPKQEKWIYQNKDLPVKISMGIGGSIDVFAGIVKRAPNIFIKLNIEWLYRILKQPKRILRMGALPVFVLKVMFQKIKNKKVNTLMKKFIEFLEISIGAFLVAFGVEVFFVPHNLVIGGVSGIAIIVLDISKNWIFDIPVWVTVLLFNIPLLLMSFKLMGRDILIKSIYTIVNMTFFLAIAGYIPNIYPDMTLSTIFGGTVIGVGTALIIKRGATAGGTTLMAVLLRRIFKGVKTTRLLLILDVIVILMGLVMFGLINTMYAIISIFLSIKVTDVILSGFQSEKATFVISEKSKEVSEALLAAIYRGITAIPARGVYTGEQKDMLLCILSQRELIIAKEIVKQIDPKAFIIVTSVSEVLGQGFSSLDNNNAII